MHLPPSYALKGVMGASEHDNYTAKASSQMVGLGVSSTEALPPFC